MRDLVAQHAAAVKTRTEHDEIVPVTHPEAYKGSRANFDSLLIVV